jgi:predicted Zn-ribbon and HTH transcriptional regulator
MVDIAILCICRANITQFCKMHGTVQTLPSLHTQNLMERVKGMINGLAEFADPSGRPVKGVGLRPLACWDCGFEFRRVHGYLYVVNFVCCQGEVSKTVRSLIQRNSTECVVSERDLETLTMRRSRHKQGCYVTRKNLREL